MAVAKHKTKELRTEIAALQRERDGLSAILVALDRPEGLNPPDYEWHVEMAAKGMAERDNHSMPKSVTTPEAFYKVMAGAALETIGLQALLERVQRAEQQLEVLWEYSRRQPRSDEEDC
jgi:hypothetical protein